MSNLSEHLTNFLSKHPIKRGLIACSGGVDSMVLLDLLRNSGKPLLVLHVNYELRGEASDLDEALIRDYCSRHRLHFESKRVNLYSELKSEGGNLQKKARDIRYSFFESYLIEGDGIFLAHHQDDQIETFFMALSRGGGIRALSCMLEQREHVYRPLLLFTKEKLISYAQLNNIPWREDDSNQESTYARNKWRNTFLPDLKKKFPDIGMAVQELIKQFQIRLGEIQLKTQILLPEFNESGILPFKWMEHEDGEVVKELFRSKGFSHGLYEELKKLKKADKGTWIHINHPNFKTVFKESDHFYFSSNTFSFLPELVIKLVDSLPTLFDKNTIYLDPEKLTGELTIRTWKFGDRIKPIGVNGSKLISDILSDAKLPSSKKASQLVVHDDTKIIWCVGYSVSREALATERSQKMKVEVRF
jgi:tRNA(Ile)-lysidine synthase